MKLFNILLAIFSLGANAQLPWESKKHAQNETTFLGNSMNVDSHEVYPVFDNPPVHSTFQASPRTFENGEDVTLTWQNMPKNEDQNFIGMWCGNKTSAGDFLDVVKLGNKSETGAYTFPNLINMRCNYTFGYYEVKNNTSQLLSKTHVSPRQGINKSMHVHIALTNNSTERRIMWTSNNNHLPQVRLWRWRDIQKWRWYNIKYSQEESEESYNNLYNVFNGTVREKYNASMMCGPPANQVTQQWFRDPGYQKEVLVTGLDPKEFYFYSIGDEKNGWSDAFHLYPEIDNDSQFKFVAYGDLGINQPNAAQGTVDRILDREGIEMDFLLHFGDISYARGKGWIWERFFNMIEPLARHTPYMVSIGNHEYDHTGQPHKDPSGIKDGGFRPYWGNFGDDSSGECSVPMYYRFHMPDNGNSIYWYSFDFSLVHVIQMSTEHNFTLDSPQYRWLEEDLKSVDRGKTPYVVVTGHRPMYTSEMSYEADYIVSLAMQDELEDLFYKYEVDLALWGHYHSYERTCPVYKQVCNEKGTTHIVVGTAGAGLEKGTFGGKGFEWSKANGVEWGYLAVTVNQQQMHVEFVRNSDGGVKDEAFLPNKRTEFADEEDLFDVYIDNLVNILISA
jgi:acid phosphatase type 7